MMIHFSLYRITRNCYVHFFASTFSLRRQLIAITPSPIKGPAFTSSKTGEISKDGPQRNCLSISQVSLSSANLSLKKIIAISRRYLLIILTDRVSSDSSTGPLTHAL